MAMALNPAGRSLKYIDHLSATPSVVEDVKEKFWKEIQDKVKDVVVKRAQNFDDRKVHVREQGEKTAQVFAGSG